MRRLGWGGAFPVLMGREGPDIGVGRKGPLSFPVLDIGVGKGRGLSCT